MNTLSPGIPMEIHALQSEYLIEDYRSHRTSWKMVCAWAYWLAFRAGRRPPQVTQSDYEQAIRELEVEQEVETGLL